MMKKIAVAAALVVGSLGLAASANAHGYHHHHFHGYGHFHVYKFYKPVYVYKPACHYAWIWQHGHKVWACVY
jgi:hypothetical protein